MSSEDVEARLEHVERSLALIMPLFTERPVRFVSGPVSPNPGPGPIDEQTEKQLSQTQRAMYNFYLNMLEFMEDFGRTFPGHWMIKEADKAAGLGLAVFPQDIFESMKGGSLSPEPLVKKISGTRLGEE